MCLYLKLNAKYCLSPWSLKWPHLLGIQAHRGCVLWVQVSPRLRTETVSRMLITGVMVLLAVCKVYTRGQSSHCPTGRRCNASAVCPSWLSVTPSLSLSLSTFYCCCCCCQDNSLGCTVTIPLPQTPDGIIDAHLHACLYDSLASALSNSNLLSLPLILQWFHKCCHLL